VEILRIWSANLGLHSNTQLKQEKDFKNGFYTKIPYSGAWKLA